MTGLAVNADLAIEENIEEKNIRDSEKEEDESEKCGEGESPTPVKIIKVTYIGDFDYYPSPFDSNIDRGLIDLLDSPFVKRKYQSFEYLKKAIEKHNRNELNSDKKVKYIIELKTLEGRGPPRVLITYQKGTEEERESFVIQDLSNYKGGSLSKKLAADVLEKIKEIIDEEMRTLDEESPDLEQKCTPDPSKDPCVSEVSNTNPYETETPSPNEFEQIEKSIEEDEEETSEEYSLIINIVDMNENHISSNSIAVVIKSGDEEFEKTITGKARFKIKGLSSGIYFIKARAEGYKNPYLDDESAALGIVSLEGEEKEKEVTLKLAKEEYTCVIKTTFEIEFPPNLEKIFIKAFVNKNSANNIDIRWAPKVISRPSDSTKVKFTAFITPLWDESEKTAYAEFRVVDENGNELGENYRYPLTILGQRWLKKEYDKGTYDKTEDTSILCFKSTGEKIK